MYEGMTLFYFTLTFSTFLSDRYNCPLVINGLHAAGG